MWLDRISGAAHSAAASTPQPGRSFSPLPRRTSSNLSPYVTSQRAAGSTPPRGSTLSLVSNDSTASLLSSSKRPNGSNLKQSTTVDDGPEPLEVLEKLLGSKTSNKPTRGKGSSTITEEDLVCQFDFAGKSLRELALSEDVDVVPVEQYRPQTVEECTKQPLQPCRGA